MKFFVATDLHGSAYWAEKVVQQFEKSAADTLVLLGDIYNHGPRNPFPQDYNPMKVADILNAVSGKLVVIKGNCDSEVDQMISKFTFMGDQSVFAFGRRLYFTHGHVYNKDSLPCLSAGDVLFYGHFHKNEIVEVSGVTCVNVSSCALPKDQSSFCIVDETGVSIRSFDGKTLLCKKF